VLTEGAGLALRRRWAEYFTIIITASFLPLEIYELVHRVTGVKVVVMAINLAILVFLIARVRRGPEAEDQSGAALSPYVITSPPRIERPEGPATHD
jgi:uncharacterized membrane protein (DUF2068 family)